MKRTAFALLGLTLAAIPVPARASDGRIEINQAKVLAGGVNPSDLAGFPAQISVPGSYILTSDLDLSTAPTPENTTAIEVTANGVTIDLNGSSIRGTTTCTGAGSSLSCSPLGSGFGIHVTGAQFAIRNGAIRGVGGKCILGGQGAGVGENLDLLFCGGGGIDIRGDVRNVRAESTNGAGIRAFEGVVDRCSGIGNLFEGIVAQMETTVSNSVVAYNGASGIFAAYSTVVDNLARNNEGFEYTLNWCGWSGNTAVECGTLPCQTGASLQTGVNNCDGAPCP